MRSTSAGRVRRESTATGAGAGRSGEGIAGKAVWMIKSLLCAYVVTGIFLLILTLLLYKMGLSEENVNAGITLIYVISTFAGGFVMGKLTGSRKFLWGLLAGILYFLLLVLISLGLYHSLQSEISGLITTFLLCAGGGMLGGMIA
ncbi:MAG TPA: TIGR04086 family membrane protein [Candidatus Mediterraneibacter cottocaccae]|nr:TIGR04086 family membrane protein [Candidatus Mediterraneibacter cottocaccae]